MERQFPRTQVGALSLSRMMIGTNWMFGYSHTGAAMDRLINSRYPDAESFMPMFEAYLRYGVDTVLGPISDRPAAVQAIRMAEQRFGKKLIVVDTPHVNVDDTPQARREAQEAIRRSRQAGASLCLIHHVCAEQLVNKNKREISRLDDYTAMIRDEGMLPGLSAHMPELVVYSDQNGYDVETYIQIFNCMGFMMQVEIESVARIIHSAQKPVITIKSMAAGRCTPYVGLTFSWNAIRQRDMIAVGAFTPDEVHEDVEISYAAFDHRYPELKKRASPVAGQAVFGK